MAWQEGVHQIIMLTNTIEDGKVGQGQYHGNWAIYRISFLK